MSIFRIPGVLVIALIACTILVGCGEKDEDGDDKMDSGPDSSGDVDTDADADTDTDTDTGPADPCTPNPCDTPPDAGCIGNNYEIYPAMGNCTETDAGTAACDYPPDASTDCGSQFCSAPLTGCVDCLLPVHCVGWLETCDSTGTCSCNDDSFEPNNSQPTASADYSGMLTLCTGDDDWWVVNADPFVGCGMEFQVQFTHANGNLDAEIFLPSDLVNPECIANSTTDDEWLWTSQETGLIYVHVFGVSGAANTYTLWPIGGGC